MLRTSAASGGGYLKKFNATFKSYGLTQLIVDITRPYKNSGTCIDWIITSSTFVYKSGVDDHLISDHLPVYCTRKKKWEHYNIVTIEARDYTNYSLENLQNLLIASHWTSYDICTDPNEMYDVLLDRPYNILAIICPIRRFKQHTSNANWINRDIYNAIRTRKFYVSLFKITQRNLRLSHVWRNKVNTMVDKAISYLYKITT